MKITKNFTFALAVIAATLLFQPSSTLAGGKGKSDEHGQQAKVTYTKWVTTVPFVPGLIANMEGVVGGKVGDGIFTGEVLLNVPTATGSHIVAIYHFTGPKHSFTALVNVVRTGIGLGTTAAISGIVTEGWLQGHPLEGEFTEIQCTHDGITTACYEGSLEVQRDSRD